MFMQKFEKVVRVDSSCYLFTLCPQLFRMRLLCVLWIVLFLVCPEVLTNSWGECSNYAWIQLSVLPWGKELQLHYALYIDTCFCLPLFCRDDLGFRLLSEQVSHHPPISAFYAEGLNNDFVFHGSIYPKLKFWGKSVEAEPKGTMTLELLE